MTPRGIRVARQSIEARPWEGASDRVRAMEHAHHEGMMHGHGGAAMGSMSGGMPVAFDWGTRVTLFFHSWATETTLDYLVALIGVFLLCLSLIHI